MNKLIQRFYIRRANYYAKKILPFIKKGEKVLDAGAGSGYMAELINKKAPVTLIDICDYNQSSLPLTLYDGKRLPYADNSFDVGLIVAVLHHTPNPEKFIAEVKRVCKRIIIVEEVYKSIAGRIFIDAWEWFWNQTSGISTFYNFHSQAEWKEIFANINLRAETIQEFRGSAGTIKMNLIVLKPIGKSPAKKRKSK